MDCPYGQTSLIIAFCAIMADGSGVVNRPAAREENNALENRNTLYA
jgi:hypothetical protein